MSVYISAPRLDSLDFSTLGTRYMPWLSIQPNFAILDKPEVGQNSDFRKAVVQKKVAPISMKLKSYYRYAITTTPCQRICTSSRSITEVKQR